MSEEDQYTYPDSATLRNRLGIQDASDLEEVERAFVAQRIRMGVPEGNFDLDHLRAIHRHLFQDVYEWAGEVRTVRMSKGDQTFQDPRYIDRGMAYVHSSLEETNFLRGLSPDDFAQRAGVVLGDVNHVHPFREGNGRTQLQYLKQLGEQAGHSVDLRRLDPERWVAASQEANVGRYDLMASEVASSIGVASPRLAPEPAAAVDQAQSQPSWEPEP